MITSFRALALAAVILGAVTACGSSAPAANVLPVIHLVGNTSCPTSSSTTPYNTDSSGKAVPPDVNSMPPVGEPVDEMPHAHVNQGTTVTYLHDPPTSGCHFNLGYGNAPIQTGAYNKVVAAEFWVHNLEHGYVAVLYNCPTGCDAQFQQLRQWYHGLTPDSAVGYPKVIIIPWPSMNVPFAAVSWDWYDPIPTFSVSEVQRFYANHTGHGPEIGGA